MEFNYVERENQQQQKTEACKKQIPGTRMKSENLTLQVGVFRFSSHFESQFFVYAENSILRNVI